MALAEGRAKRARDMLAWVHTPSLEIGQLGWFRLRRVPLAQQARDRPGNGVRRAWAVCPQLGCEDWQQKHTCREGSVCSEPSILADLKPCLQVRFGLRRCGALRWRLLGVARHLGREALPPLPLVFGCVSGSRAPACGRGLLGVASVLVDAGPVASVLVDAPTYSATGVSLSCLDGAWRHSDVK